MDKFEEYIKARYPVDYEHLKEKYPNVPVGEFYGDEKDLWNYRQAELEEKDKWIKQALMMIDHIQKVGLISSRYMVEDVQKALKGNDQYTEHHSRAEQQINKGARLTKHQIDLGDKNANS